MNVIPGFDASAAGMDRSRLADAFRLLDEEVARGEIPGGVALVGRNGRIAGIHAAGLAKTGGTGTGADADNGEAGLPARADTIYDCASLTKVVVTLPLILMLIDRGKVRLDDPVIRFVPEFAAGGKEAVTVKHLLTHTSGLAPFVDLHSHGWTPEEIRRTVYEQPLQYETGTDVVYSDLGFIVLGDIAAAVLGQPLDQAARTHLFEPLGMNDSRFVPPAELKPRIAATEFDAGLGRHKWGEVHDENAYALGGVSGHAGLFSTAADLAKYAAMWLNGGRHEGKQILSRAVVEAAIRSYTPGMKGNRGLGWVLKGDKYDASGDLFSASSYGHTGFTGTSIWMDPATNCFAVLLTNRVHFGRDKSVARLRACFHNAVAASCI